MAPPSTSHAPEPLIPPPTGLTLPAPQLQGPAPTWPESSGPASHRPRPSGLHSAQYGLGPRSSGVRCWLRPSPGPRANATPNRPRPQQALARPGPSSAAPGDLWPRPSRPPLELRALSPCGCGSGGLRAPQAEGLLQGACLAPLQGLPPSVQLRSAAGEGNDPERNPIESGRVDATETSASPVPKRFPHPVNLS